MPTVIVVQVAIPLPLDRTFDYAVPDRLEACSVPGTRVLVPFGHRKLTGVVVSTSGESTTGADELREVEDVLDDVPALSDELLQLTRWIADYYVCGWGEAIKAALPAGIEVESQRRVSRTEQVTDERLDDAARAVLDYLAERDDATIAQLRRDIDGFSVSTLARLERRGLALSRVVVGSQRVRVKHERRLRFAPRYRTKSIADIVAHLRGQKQRTLVEVLAGAIEDGEDSAAQTAVLEAAEASHTSLKSLVEKGVVEAFDEEVDRSAATLREAGYEPRNSITLNSAQTQALTKIGSAIDQRCFETFMLHGVTGSGKTEVYLSALRQVLDKGRNGIILVPEIALTPQTVARFRSRFGERIAVLHSRMSPGERYDAWRRIRSGEHRIVIGARSAVLAPLADIGLIVVDEEHEYTYKQFDPAPRYHARDVAIMRAKSNDAVCVLGTATPSLESHANAEAGKYTLLSMPDRVPNKTESASKLPKIRVVDLTIERKKDRLDGVLSEPLRAAIALRLQRDEQTILLQNRRGYAPVLECEQCGWAPECVDCSVTMTYHKATRTMRCHYCGRVTGMVHKCAQCGSGALGQIGVGTQKVEEELRSLFPDARILRMDMDTTGAKNAHHRILERFGRGDADILLGTQMVAKGLDFERVSLVGVVDSDSGLLLPDFRSEERTFQLLTQVAGRAGRADILGEVFLQTRNPKNPAIIFALLHDYAGFANYALRHRRELGYPPYSRIVSIRFRGPDEDGVRSIATEWTAALRILADIPSILGPHAAFIARVKRDYRYHTIVKVPLRFGTERLRTILREVSESVRPPSGYRVAIDVDPIGLL